MHPLLVKRVLFPLHERVLGKRTLDRLGELRRTQWLDERRLEEYRFARLKRLLTYAYTNVPYYRRAFDEHEVPPQRVHSFEDFRRVPYLTREDLRTHFESLTPRVKVPRSRPFSTGGSTGSPVTVRIDMERMAFSDASRLRAHGWFGLDIGAREISLWGAVRDLSRQGRLRGWRDRLLNWRILSAFDMSEAALAEYADILQRFRPQKIYGYATAITLLSQYLMSRGLSAGGSLRAVFTTAEPLYDYQRAVIREGLGGAVAQEYGSRDAGMVANECPAGGLHINAEGFHVELLGPAGEAGELVVTNFDSPAMPIIRYRTQDIGTLSDARCSCDRSLPLLASVQGRSTDFLVAPDGRVLHALSVIYVLREVPGLKEFRVTQEAIDRLVVQLVPEPGFKPERVASVVSALGQLMGSGVDVEVNVTEAILRPVSGKYRYVVSKIADEHLNTLLARAAR